MGHGLIDAGTAVLQAFEHADELERGMTPGTPPPRPVQSEHKARHTHAPLQEGDWVAVEERQGCCLLCRLHCSHHAGVPHLVGPLSQDPARAQCSAEAYWGGGHGGHTPRSLLSNLTHASDAACTQHVTVHNTPSAHAPAHAAHSCVRDVWHSPAQHP